MKRMILLSAMMSMFFMACTEKPDEPPPTPTPTPEEAEIRIDATSVVIPVDGGTESVKFNSTQKIFQKLSNKTVVSFPVSDPEDPQAITLLRSLQDSHSLVHSSSV